MAERRTKRSSGGKSRSAPRKRQAGGLPWRIVLLAILGGLAIGVAVGLLMQRDEAEPRMPKAPISEPQPKAPQGPVRDWTPSEPSSPDVRPGETGDGSAPASPSAEQRPAEQGYDAQEREALDRAFESLSDGGAQN